MAQIKALLKSVKDLPPNSGSQAYIIQTSPSSEDPHLEKCMSGPVQVEHLVQIQSYPRGKGGLTT